MPNIVMTVGDVSREFDIETMLISEARECERLTGFEMDEFRKAFFRGRSTAVAFAWWLASKRAGEPIEGSFADLDFDMGRTQLDVVSDIEPEVARPEDSDPDFPTGPEQEQATSLD